MKKVMWATMLTAVSVAGWGQVLTPRTSAPHAPPASFPALPSASMPLVVPAGTPLKVVLDKEVRIRKAGQPLSGKLGEALYAFDRMVVPAGTEVTGKVDSIARVSKKARVLAAMNADLSPYRNVEVEFDALRFADGREIQLYAAVSRAPRALLEFVPAGNELKSGTVSAGRSWEARTVREAKRKARQEWDLAMQQLHAPNKVHRAERAALARLPYHPQYIDVGSPFDADLTLPLNFGTETITSKSLASIGAPPPPGSVVHATLAAALSSATAKKGDPVEAVISQPLVVEGRLYAPEGSRLEGTVLQVRPARRLGRNGQLRLVFHQLVPPGGVAHAFEANLKAVEVARDEQLTLDSEGGAQVTTPKMRYLTTAISVALAAASVSPDPDREVHGNGGDVGGSAARGVSGYKAIGMIMGAFVHSRALSTGLGVYGASMAVYSHFLARGRDVNYPRDMSILVALGTPDSHVSPNQGRVQ